METSLEHKRHTLAHLLAAAVLIHYPHAKPTIGPAIADGFYYDFEFPKTKGKSTAPGEQDLKRIEDTMRELLPFWHQFSREKVTPQKALKVFKGNKYKEELIKDLRKAKKDITFYTAGPNPKVDLKKLKMNPVFLDLCRGGHAKNPAQEIAKDSFKLDRIAGAYWRGDEKNAALTRIYGLAFEDKAGLDAFLHQREEAQKRDHRTLGEKLDLFHFDESIGKGLPIWLPKGNIIKEELEKWAKETEAAWGYSRVTTPIITKEDLFYTSGHLPLYAESMYAPIRIENENYYIKPMNCPFHHKTYAARPKSYRDLPLRLAEYGWCHRYEDSGSLFGLMRVRGMQMNDAHIYVQREKAVEEFVKVIKLHEYYYKTLGINTYEMELALRDPKKKGKYHGDEKDWKEAERMTKEAMELSGVPYKVVNEGAAFYGPKMDFQIYSSIGRSFTASTNQLDLYMGKRFDLKYTDADGKEKIPAIIHRAPLGTHERFIGFLIEHYAGAFPLWLSPEQVRVLPVSEKHAVYAASLVARLRDAGIRADLSPDESLGKRIRDAKVSKLPYFMVVGDQEVAAETATLEGRAGKVGVFPIDEVVNRLKEEIVLRKG